jgi:hypothetical protein
MDRLAKTKPPREERAIIVQQPAKRPYGTRASAHLQTAISMGNTEGVCLLLDSGAFVTIEPGSKPTWEGGAKVSLTLEGFPTAAAAEAGGRKLVQALLWTAISINFALRLEYTSYEPTTVFDRIRSGGVSSEGSFALGQSVDRVLDELRESYAELADPNPSVLLSMEIFAGARLEISQRARFLAIVSALEPLAEDRSLGPDASAFVDSCIANLDKDPVLTQPVRASLRGRLEQLRHESIRQGILRVVREALPKMAEAPGLVDEAYAVRSQVVHQGRPDDLDVNLEDVGRDVSEVLRELYAVRLARSLKVPTRAG